jgi:hypothetical protein
MRHDGVEFIGVLAKHLPCKGYQHAFVRADNDLLSTELERPYRFAREVFARHSVLDPTASRNALGLAVRHRQLLKASFPKDGPVADTCGLCKSA